MPAAGGRRRPLSQPLAEEVGRAGRSPKERQNLTESLSDAAYAFERERYEDARRLLRRLARRAPDSSAVRELLGLVHYRTGKWSAAAAELEAFRRLSGSSDQDPVLADCYRAMKRYRKAEAIWAELRAASPSAEIVAEGRIVAAGCLADQGNLAGAIRLLERGLKPVRKPGERHIRMWYALGDLYERAGDVPHARDLFRRVLEVDPDAYDADRRLVALG